MRETMRVQKDKVKCDSVARGGGEGGWTRSGATLCVVKQAGCDSTVCWERDMRSPWQLHPQRFGNVVSPNKGEVQASHQYI